MKRALAVLLFIAGPVNAQVSGTAAPVANSSGSVTNMAIQNVPGRQFTNTYGSGISCQGATLNISPFVNGQTGWASPYEKYYDENVYDTLDLVGAFDPEGNPQPDGIPDNPGNILYTKPVRTGQKQNTSINAGITATISIPLDRHHVRTCRKAAEKQVQIMEATLADRRLNYEIARLKNCSELMKQGVIFHPSSPYSSICADVVLVNPPGVLPPHIHSIPTSLETVETSDAAKPTQQQLSSPASP